MATKSYEVVFQAFKPYIQGKANVNDQLPDFDKELIQDLIKTSIDKLKEYPTVINVPAPCIIVGDLHGNINDLINILKRFNDFSSHYFLFLGDYVDRGLNSIEVVSLLFAMMCKFPNNFFLIRGNHEFACVNRQYGFREEIQIVYRNQEVWLNFQDLFNWLPLAAVVNNQIFCVHGGLSPSLHKIETINNIQRPIKNYDNPIISDLVWSDPYDQVHEFSENQRGSGVFYGEQAVKNFLIDNDMKLLIRAHQCMADGFSTFASNAGITVFSSSEYAKAIHNKCGILKIFPKGKIQIFCFSHDNFNVLEPKYTMTISKTGIGMRRLIKRSPISNVGQSKQITSNCQAKIENTKTQTSSKRASSNLLNRQPNITEKVL